MSTRTESVETDGRLDSMQHRVWPAGLSRLHSLAALAAAESRLAAYSLLGTMLLIALCAAAIVIGWGLILASLLYVVADYSTTTWLLTALSLAIGHAVLAAACWQYATALGRNVTLPELRNELWRGNSCAEKGDNNELASERSSP